MSDLLANPAIQSGAIPFIIALLVAAALGFPALGTARLAGLAALAGFLAAYVVTLGWPPLPPKSSGQKIFYVALIAGVAGSIFEIGKTELKGRLVIGFAISAASILWIGWRKVMAAPSLDHLSVLLLLIGTGIAIFAMERDGKDGADKTVPILIVSLAMAGIALLGASASIGQNAGALSAALGGLMILNWPIRRFGLNVISRLVPLTVLASLVAQATLFTSAPAWIPALLLPALFADRLVDLWIPAGSHRAPLARPVFVGFVAAVPAAVALSAAWFAASSSGMSGGY
jgi:hypothetical protein